MLGGLLVLPACGAFTSPEKFASSALSSVNTSGSQSSASVSKYSGQPKADVVTDDTVILNTELDVSFGQVSTLMQSYIDTALEPVVQRTNCSSISDSSYQCGEIPFGTIVDSSRKEIFNIDISSFSGSDSGANYSLNGATISVYLNRQANASQIQIDSLDKVGTATFPTSPLLGDDVYQLLNPQNGTLLHTTCLVLPGMTASADPITLTGTVRKSVFFLLPDIVSNVTVHIDAGSMKTDATNVCLELSTTVDANGLPVVKLVKMDTPTYIGLVNSGLNVTVTASLDSFWSFINDITSLFGTNIKKIIVNAVTSRAQAVAQNTINVKEADVTSGAYIAKYLAGTQTTQMLSAFTTSLRTTLQQNGWGNSSIQDAVKTLCVAAIAGMSLPTEQAQQVAQLCVLAPTLNVSLFVDDESQRSQGCYGAFFNPRSPSDASGNPKWWSAGCQIKNNLQLVTSSRLVSVYSCLAGAWNQRLVPSSVCLSELTDLITGLETGQFADIQQLLTTVPPFDPSPTEIAWIQNLAQTQLGIELPSASSLQTLLSP